MWQVAAYLKRRGIASFNGKQVKPGEDWMQKWLGKMPDAQVCIAMLSPAYFQSRPCKEELYMACRDGLYIIPVIFEKTPMKRAGYFGTSDEDRERGNFVWYKMGNYLPSPEKGLFQDKMIENCEELEKLIRQRVDMERLYFLLNMILCRQNP